MPFVSQPYHKNNSFIIREYIKIEIDSFNDTTLIKNHSIQLWISDQLSLRSSLHSLKTGLAHLGMIYFTRLCGLIPNFRNLPLTVWRRLKLSFKKKHSLKASFNALSILCKLQVLKNESIHWMVLTSNNNQSIVHTPGIPRNMGENLCIPT